MPVYETVEIRKRTDNLPEGELIAILNGEGVHMLNEPTIGSFEFATGRLLLSRHVLTLPLTAQTSDNYIFTFPQGRYHLESVKAALLQPAEQLATLDLRLCQPDQLPAHGASLLELPMTLQATQVPITVRCDPLVPLVTMMSDTNLAVVTTGTWTSVHGVLTISLTRIG